MGVVLSSRIIGPTLLVLAKPTASSLFITTKQYYLLAKLIWTYGLSLQKLIWTYGLSLLKAHMDVYVYNYTEKRSCVPLGINSH